MGQRAWAGYRAHLLRQEMRLRKQIIDAAQKHNPANVMDRLVRELQWCENAVKHINQLEVR